MRKDFGFRYCSTFICLCQILSNHGLTRIKDSSHDLQLNGAISFYFYLYLILHACAERFDVTRNLENFLVFGRTKQDLRATVYLLELLSEQNVQAVKY